mgnify:CR=1 FL=1
MKFDENALSEIEKKDKLNWMEKRAVKKFLKKAKKSVQKYKGLIELETKDREILEKEVLSLTDILEIENDDGEELNKDNIKKLSNKELEDALEMSLEEMEKLLWKLK